MRQLLFSCLLLAVWVSICLAPLSAQTSFGLHGGLNYGKIRYDKLPQLEGDNVPGYFLGTTLQHRFSDHFSGGLDAQFSLKVSKTSTLGATDHQSRYLELAPRADYFFTKNIGVSLGLYVAYLLEQRIRTNDGTWIRTDQFFDIASIDAGIVPGVSLRFGRAFGFLRYTHGLLAMDKSEYTNEKGASDTARLFNRYFQAGIGYIIFE